MPTANKSQGPISTAVEITIRLIFLLALIAWCFQILAPFVSIILWAAILAMATSPVYLSINKRLGDKPKWAAAILIILGLLVIIIPSGLFVGSIIDGIQLFKKLLESDSISIPAPNPSVEEWPIIGERLYETWKSASVNLGTFIEKYSDQISQMAGSVLDALLGIGGSIVQFVFATIIAGILLSVRGTKSTASVFFGKLVGEKGEEFAQVTEVTVRKVTQGVLGVALILAVLNGIGFILAGVPYPGLWALMILIIATLQLPSIIVVLPVVIYLFSVESTLTAGLWTAYFFVVSLSDNFLKPLLLGKGAPVPMLVIFLGVLGGFMLSGFIGLFTGAIVLSLGYKLFISWMYSEVEEKPVESI